MAGRQEKKEREEKVMEGEREEKKDGKRGRTEERVMEQERKG